MAEEILQRYSVGTHEEDSLAERAQPGVAKLQSREGQRESLSENSGARHRIKWMQMFL